MPDVLVLVGLVLGLILYALLVRRRKLLRDARRELASSTQVALARVGEASRRRAEGGRATPPVVELPPKEEPPGRRSNRDRRNPDRRRGRGRRKGGDRRVEGSPNSSGGAQP